MAVNLPFDAQRANSTIMNVVLKIATTVFVFLGAVTASTTRIKVLDAASAIGVCRMVVVHCAQREICCAVRRCSDCYKECNVIDCKKPRNGASYCKIHTNPYTRCCNCNQGLPDGNETNFCSICYVLCHKECYVVDCKEPRSGGRYVPIHQPGVGVGGAVTRIGVYRYCKRHSDPKTRCRKCNRNWGLVEGSEIHTLCSTCNLLCRTKNCMNQIAEGSRTLCSTCNLLCRTKNWWETSVDGVTKLCSTCLVAAPKKKPAPTYEQIQQEIARHQAKVTKALEKPFWKYGRFSDFPN